MHSHGDGTWCKSCPIARRDYRSVFERLTVVPRAQQRSRTSGLRYGDIVSCKFAVKYNFDGTSSYGIPLREAEVLYKKPYAHKIWWVLCDGYVWEVAEQDMFIIDDARIPHATAD